LYVLLSDPEVRSYFAGKYPEQVRKEFEYIAACVQYQNRAMNELLEQSPTVSQPEGETTVN